MILNQEQIQTLLDYVTDTPDLIDSKMIEAVAIDPHEAFVIYLSLLLGFEEEEKLFQLLYHQVILPIQLDESIVEYHRLLSLYDPTKKMKVIQPYELILLNKDEKSIQLGYFQESIQLDPECFKDLYLIENNLLNEQYEIHIQALNSCFYPYYLLRNRKVHSIFIHEDSLEKIALFKWLIEHAPQIDLNQFEIHFDNGK